MLPQNGPFFLANLSSRRRMACSTKHLVGQNSFLSLGGDGSSLLMVFFSFAMEPEGVDDGS